MRDDIVEREGAFETVKRAVVGEGRRIERRGGLLNMVLPLCFESED